MALYIVIILLLAGILTVSLLFLRKIDGAVQNLTRTVDGLGYDIQGISDRLDALEAENTETDGPDSGQETEDPEGGIGDLDGTLTEEETSVIARVTQNDAFCYFPEEDELEDGFITDFQTEFNEKFSEGIPSFTFGGERYRVVSEGSDLYAIYTPVGTEGPALLGIFCKDMVYASDEGAELPFEVQHEALRAWANSEETFTVSEANGIDMEVSGTGGVIEYALDENGNLLCEGEMVGYISRYTVLDTNGELLPRDLAVQVEAAIRAGDGIFECTSEDGMVDVYTVIPGEDGLSWSVIAPVPAAQES